MRRLPRGDFTAEEYTVPIENEIASIIRAANQCPESFTRPLDQSLQVQELARHLTEGGFHGLSRAVFHGQRWIEAVAQSGTVHHLETAELQAAMPGWLWNEAPPNWTESEAK